MPTAKSVPLPQYLSNIYPDCDFVQGILEERNVGEISHSDAQSAPTVYLRTHFSGFWSVVEVRVRVKADRFRIPDITVVRGVKPAGRVITGPPEVAVEVLSPEDRAVSIQDRIDDYLAFGVPCVWLEGSREVKDGMLRNVARDLAVPMAAVFPE